MMDIKRAKETLERIYEETKRCHCCGQMLKDWMDN